MSRPRNDAPTCALCGSRKCREAGGWVCLDERFTGHPATRSARSAQLFESGCLMVDGELLVPTNGKGTGR